MSVCTPVTKETLPVLLESLDKETNAEKFMGVPPSRMVDFGWKYLHITESLIFGSKTRMLDDTVVAQGKFIEVVKDRTSDDK